uniref:Chromogranin-A n=1 Tax=Lepisosteus oculatus TaxID=7918 RepID=W5N685_LEPOC
VPEFRKMIARGCFLLTLVFHHVLSLPVSSNHVDKEDAKVMKCIVEVIADTLSKPSPIPISQECLDSLRGDERIISILRHQNLLKELQELASQGASERAQQQEKGDHLEDQIPAVLEDALDKDQSMLDALKKPESYTEKREAELSENEVEESAESDGESLEGNEVEEPKEEEKREGGPEKLIPASLSLEEEKATVGTEGKAESEENETEKEDNSEADKDEEGSRTDAATSVPDVHKVKNSLQGEGGDQQEQTEEKRSSEEEEEEEKKRSQGEEEEERSAESSQTSQPKGLLTRDLQRHRHAAQHHSKEDSSREERSRAQETVAHSEADERREEEGSASRKAEDQEIESLAAIESELENVAQKLHELRKG